MEKYKMDKSGDLSPAFHLTFDDGLKEVYTHIAPLLEEKGIPATFFVNTDFIDNKKLFYRYKIGLLLEEIGRDENNAKALEISKIVQQNSKWHLDCRSSLLRLNYHDQEFIDELGDALGLDFHQWLQENNPYLTTAQINELIDRGFSFGSHSCDHPRFKNIDFDSQKKQIEHSFDFLKRTFEIKERYFSFPFGDEEVGKNLFDWMEKEANVGFSFGVSGLKDDYTLSHFHRIPMDMCSGQTEKFIKSEYLYFMIKRIFRKNQIHRE
ncbi:MAG: polysaccharide deacetylase family protein [Saprospiraceae bacterium]|nr:polysaccharide deacetylase family protein [Saprospiraceae bacterium]